MAYPEHKSPEHRAAISAGLKRHHEKQRQLRSAMSRLDYILIAGREKGTLGPTTAIDELVESLLEVLKVFAQDQADGKARTASAKARADQLQAKVYELTGKVHRQGGNLKAMDGFELRHAAKMGLVDQGEADAEMRRRVRTGVFEDRPPGDLLAGSVDAAISGFLICGQPGCNRQVNVVDGSYCPEHKRAEPRSWISAGFTARNLDFELETAEQVLTKVRREFDKAQAEVEDLQKQISAYDATHRPD